MGIAFIRPVNMPELWQGRHSTCLISVTSVGDSSRSKMFRDHCPDTIQDVNWDLVPTTRNVKAAGVRPAAM